MTKIIGRDPDLASVSGQAWHIRLRHDQGKPDWDANVSNWIVNCPWAHPFWNAYLVAACHLRPIEGTKPPFKQFADATHELSVFALSPEVDIDINGMERNPLFEVVRILTPANLVYQCRGVTDEQMAEITRLLVTAFVHAQESPDTDFSVRTRQTLDATVAHYQEGVHV